MKRIDDMARWTEAALDTPFKARIDSDPPQQGYYPPGICVKSRECSTTPGGKPGLPKFYGRVVTFDREKNYALVRSYGSRFDGEAGSDPKLAGTVWEGTTAECVLMWRID